MSKIRLLLVSSSVVHGSGYLEHCGAAVERLFQGLDRILFVPFALADRDGYAAKVRGRFSEFGIDVDSLHESTNPRATVEEARGFFVGGGNTFRLLKTIQDLDLTDPIRDRVEQGIPYMGTSAGSNLACPSLRTTNDMPIVQPRDFEALGLVPFQLNPHYIDPDPSTTHKGETRDLRLQEFHEENDIPVLALREGAMLEVQGDSMVLLGHAGGKLFRKEKETRNLAEGEVLDELLLRG